MKYLSSKRIRQLLAKVMTVAIVASGCSLFLPTDSQAGTTKQTNQQKVLDWKQYVFSRSNSIEDPEQNQQFKDDVIAFQKRAEADKLDASEIIYTYSAVNDLLSSSKQMAVDSATRINLAEVIMHHAAEPTSIDQGHHPICAPDALIVRFYTRSPAEMAQTLHSLAATGSFTAADGKTVTLDYQTLQRDQEATNFQIDKASDDASWSVDTKLLVATCSNLYLKETGSTLEYRQLVKPEFYGDTSSRLFDPKTGKIRIVQPSDFASSLTMADQMYFLLTGKRETNFSIIGGKFSTPGAYSVKTAADLHNALCKIKASGLLPAVVEVQTKNEPFKSDSPRASSGWHEVSVMDYNPNTGYALIDNEWGRINDHLNRWDGKPGVPYTVLIDAINDAAHAQPPPVPMPVPLTHKVKRTLGAGKTGK